MEFLKNPMFWVAVVLVCLAVNYAWSKFMGGKGKLT
jgi:hypothetical protein